MAPQITKTRRENHPKTTTAGSVNFIDYQHHCRHRSYSQTNHIPKTLDLTKYLDRTTPTNYRPFDFPGLPTEIQLQILKYGLIDDYDIKPHPLPYKLGEPKHQKHFIIEKKKRLPVPPRRKAGQQLYRTCFPTIALLGVSQRMYALAAPILYSENVWQIKNIGSAVKDYHYRFWRDHHKKLKRVSWAPTPMDALTPAARANLKSDSDWAYFMNHNTVSKWEETLKTLQETPVQELTINTDGLAWAGSDILDELPGKFLNLLQTYFGRKIHDDWRLFRIDRDLALREIAGDRMTVVFGSFDSEAEAQGRMDTKGLVARKRVLID